MGRYKEVEGDLIKLAKEGNFDVIIHGCNCFCSMGSGIAPQIATVFGCDTFPLESNKYKGDINKLGSIDYQHVAIEKGKWCNGGDRGSVKFFERCNIKYVTVVNAYTQYGTGRQKNGEPALDYDALTMVMKKVNHIFKGKKIGLPRIGAGLAGGDWFTISQIIQTQLKDCEVIVVNYKP